MINPFDRTFFKFLLGFALILCLSIAVMYIASRYKAGLALLPSVSEFSGLSLSKTF